MSLQNVIVVGKKRSIFKQDKLGKDSVESVCRYVSWGQASSYS